MHTRTHANQIVPPTADRSMVRQLDVIRVVAMLGVFSHHLWKTVIVAPQGALERGLDILFSAASDGVILFNIISGFLLGLPYLCPGCSRSFTGYRSFLQKRFLRVIPPYYAALLIFTLGNMLCFGVPLLPALDTLLEHLFFINSLNYSNMFLNFSHFWYLSLLAQFYLFFPFVLWLLQRFNPVRATLSIIALSWGSWIILSWLFPTANPSYPGMAEILMHFNLPGRLPEFAIGMWLASLWNPSELSLRRPLLGRAFTGFAVAMSLYVGVGIFFYSKMNLPLIHIYHVCLSTILFLILLLWPAVARRGESTVLKSLSDQSYTIYIVHYPLFSYLGVMPSKVTHTLGNFALLLATLLALSYLAGKALSLVSDGIMNRAFNRGSR